MSAATTPIERARLSGAPGDTRVIMAVPRCTCTAKAMPNVEGDMYSCPCGWLRGDGLFGWALRISSEIEYLGGQE